MKRGTNNQAGKTSPKTSKSAAVSDQERVEATINDVETGKVTGKTSSGKTSGSGKSSTSNTGKSSTESTAKTSGKTSNAGGKTSAKVSEEAPKSASKELSITEQAQYADDASGDEVEDNSGLVTALLDQADVLILKASECVRQAAKLSA